MSKTQVTPTNLETILWSKSNDYTLNDENYTKISDWWEYLAKKTIIWDVFSSLENKPLIRDVFVIENTSVDCLTFYWRKQGFDHWNTVNPQHLTLDYLTEELNIIPTSKNWFLYNYKITVLY